MATTAEPSAQRRELDDLQKLVALCKRRGFVFPSAEIYGGFANTYDYGPLGVLLKNNVRDAWIRANVQRRDDVELLDAALITSPQVWVASGHVAEFNDPLVQCLGECKSRYRADQIDATKCPNCGGPLSEPRMFNTMFRTQVGPVADEENVAYLPPETAQGIFVNFANVAATMRRKLPFGIAQVRKSFRNEITPGNFVFRTLEFEQMELEFFVPPAESPKWFEYWCDERFSWYRRYGIPDHLLRLRQHTAEELSHYSSGTADVEFLFPWGWGELEGIANRTDYDLKAHAALSGVRLEYFDQASGERYVPHVVEPAGGVTRSTMAFLLAAYDEDVVAGEPRTVLRLHPRLAPYQVAVLPLSKNERLVPTARDVLHRLQRRFVCDYDETQSIGRRYRRQDESGTPFCVTVDFETLEDHAVTIRERDSTDQVRLPIEEVVGHLSGHLEV